MVSKRLSLGVVVVALAAPCLLVLGLSVTPDAQAQTRCSSTGTPENRLTVRASESTTIGRVGEEIVVRDSGELQPL